jgi:hypothetical protein
MAGSFILYTLSVMAVVLTRVRSSMAIMVTSNKTSLFYKLVNWSVAITLNL